MTKPIEGVSERILACAREEFLEKGYSEASLRTIAAKADTTTGSIYSRFVDKEGLFCAIVEPAAEGLTQIFLKTQEAFHAVEAEEQPKAMETYITGGMDEMLDYVYDRFDDFRLLLDASYGTKYQDFVEHLVDIETEYTYKYMEATKFLQEGSMITEEFLISCREPCLTVCSKSSDIAWTGIPPENICICWRSITTADGEPSSSWGEA